MQPGRERAELLARDRQCLERQVEAERQPRKQAGRAKPERAFVDPLAQHVEVDAPAAEARPEGRPAAEVERRRARQRKVLAALAVREVEREVARRKAADVAFHGAGENDLARFAGAGQGFGVSHGGRKAGQQSPAGPVGELQHAIDVEQASTCGAAEHGLQPHVAAGFTHPRRHAQRNAVRLALDAPGPGEARRHDLGLDLADSRDLGAGGILHPDLTARDAEALDGDRDIGGRDGARARHGQGPVLGDAYGKNGRVEARLDHPHLALDERHRRDLDRQPPGGKHGPAGFAEADVAQHDLRRRQKAQLDDPAGAHRQPEGLAQHALHLAAARLPIDEKGHRESRAQHKDEEDGNDRQKVAHARRARLIEVFTSL